MTATKGGSGSSFLGQVIITYATTTAAMQPSMSVMRFLRRLSSRLVKSFRILIPFSLNNSIIIRQAAAAAKQISHKTRPCAPLLRKTAFSGAKL